MHLVSKEKVGFHIAQAARVWEGVKEIRGNQGFHNDTFATKMEDVGWKIGQAWCVYFIEIIWKEAYAGYKSVLVLLDQLFSGSAVVTFRNFSKSDVFEISQKPVEGAIAIWQTVRNGKVSWTGHAGIVISVEDNFFTTIEGNTNSTGGREGIEVARKTRHYNWGTRNGLRLKGFIHPKGIA